MHGSRMSIQFVMNNTVNSSVKATPSKLLLGYEQRKHSDINLKNLIEQLANVEHDINKERQAARDSAVEVAEKIRDYNKRYYDIKHTTPTVYKKGDFVLIRNLQGKPGQSKKLKINYKGPYIVAQALNKNRYVIHKIFQVSIYHLNHIILFYHRIN